MAYLGIALLGVIAWTRLPQELYPPITYPQLTVVTKYKDAAPEEIELLVTKLIEEVTGTVSGLRRVSSISKEELSLVIAEFNWGTNMDFAALGVREKLDLIKERLPRTAEEPVVIKYNPFELPVVVLNLSGKRAPHDLLTVARKQVKSEVEKLEGVAAVNLSGGLEREILVEVDQGRLQGAGLPITHVADALSRANMNYPAGTIKEAFYEYLIRTIGEFDVVPEMQGIAVGVDEEEESPQEKLERESQKGPLRREKGLAPRQRLILLKDIAKVKDTFKDKDSISRFNGQDNVSIAIQKQAGANTLQLADRVKESVEQLRLSLPKDLTITVAYDQSLAIRSAIAGVQSAAILGGVLAFLVLFLFLGNVWAAMNVAFAIPISILATVALMYFSGTTINIISLGGLALGIGLLVDAGIVVVENVTRHREQGSTAADAAVLGTNEVASAILASVLTTIVVFLPMVFVVGIAGQLFKELAYTVTFALLASLAVSLTLTALFASRIRSVASSSPIEPVIEFFRRLFLSLTQWFLRFPVFGIGIVILLFAGSVMSLGTLDREMLPRVDQGQFILQANLPPGSRLEVTDRIAGRIERVLQALPEVRDVTVTIGSSKEKRAEELLETLGSHQAQLMVNLRPRYRGWGDPPVEGFRTRSTAAIVQELRKTLGYEALEGAEIDYLLQESVFKSAFVSGTPVVVEVKGPELHHIERMAAQVKKKLEKVPGLYGVQTSLIPPSPETKVNIMKDRAATYHLSVSDIALTAQTALKGFIATKYKESGKEIDVRVRLREQDRRDFNGIRRLMVHSPLDIDIPLAEVAYFAIGKGPTEIRRLDQQRTVLISAQLFRRALGETLDEVTEVLKEIRVPHEYTVELTGESEQMQESFHSLAFALLLSILLVYMVMASEFESLWQPFLIMGTIPMALIGVVIALGATGTPISVMAALGFIVLGGIVVNNGIVLIDYVNLLRAQGMSLEEAVLNASQARLRPIIMTAATTILGLLPLALALQEGVELQVPMAITVMGGLFAGTFLTLIFLPTIYVIGARFFGKFRLLALPVFEQGPPPGKAGPGLPPEGPPPEEPPSGGLPPEPLLPEPPVEEGDEPLPEPELPEPSLAAEPPAPELPGGGEEEAKPYQLESSPGEEPPTEGELPAEGEPPAEEPVKELPAEGEPPQGDPSAYGLTSLGSPPEEETPSEEPAPQGPPPEVPEIPKDFGSEEAVPEQEDLSGIAPAGSIGEPEDGEAEPEAKQPPEEPREEESSGEPDQEAPSESTEERTVVAPEPEAPAEPPIDLNPRQEKLIKHLKRRGRATRQQYVKLARTSVPTAARDLKDLVDRGLIRGKGPLAKGRYYVLV